MANRDARLITKRTSVPGKIPTGTTGSESNLIQSGELASNLSDKKLFGFDGTDVFEYGTNSFLGLTGGTISGDLYVNSNLSASTFFSGSTDLDTIIRNIANNSDDNTFVTGSTLSADTTLILSRNDGVDVTTDLSIQRAISFNAEAFVLDTATRVTLTPITISTVRFAGTGQPDIAGIGFTVPDDYKDGGELSYIWRSSTTSTTLSARTEFDMYTGDTNNTGSLVTSAESFTISDTPESTANVFIYSPSYTPAVNLSAGMKIHLTITRDPGNAGDTLNSDLDITDFVFRYNALR